MSLDGSLIVDKKKKPILNKSMRNYGFDYLVEKVQVLNEMAPKSKFWNTNFPEFMNFYLDVQDKMKEHPKAPPVPKTLADKRVEYISRMLFDFLSKDELAAIGIAKNKGFEPNVRNLAIRDLSPDEIIERRKIGDKRMREFTPGYAEFAGKWADNTPKQQDYMLSLMVRAYEEKALSKKFTSKVMDDANIDAYFKKNLFKYFSSNFAFGMRNKKEELLNRGKGEKDKKIDLEEVNEIKNKAKELIKKIRKSKKIPKGLYTSIYNAPDMKDAPLTSERDENVNETMIPLLALQLTLEILLDEKKEIARLIKYKEWDEVDAEQEKLDEFDTTVIQTTLNTVSKRIDDQKPTSLDTLKTKIFPLFSDIKKTFMEEFDIAYNQLSKNSLMVPMANTVRRQEYTNIFDMLDDNLLDSLEKEGIINSEDRETLKKWANISGTLKQNIRSKGEKIVLRNIEKGTKQDEYDKKKKEFDEKNARKKAQKEEYKDKLEELKDMNIQEIEDTIYDAYNEENPDFDLIEYMEKYLGKRKKGQDNKISMNENHVMDYFTEQIQKDNLLNQRGECKERGFKKPKNYAHWLWLNEQ